VTYAYRAGLGAALVVFSSTLARAQTSSIDQARFIGAYGTIRGTELVGIGSRNPYIGVLLEADIQGTTMIGRRLGIDIDLRFGDGGVKTASGDEYFGRAATAIVTPLVQRDGIRGYSALVGAGLGLTGGDRYWWAAFRVYPYGLARFTYLFTKNISTFAQVSVAPVDTSLAAHTWVVESQYEAGIGVGLFSAGARVALTAIQGGDPARTFGDLEVGFYLGLGARFEPSKKKKIR
jgi:hypothetical protein